MKKIFGLALLATAATAGAAHAEATFSGNVALTTDYVFRGQSQTQNAPAIQGGFDYANGMFYAGAWASSIDFGSQGGLSIDAPMELDLYAGLKPVTGPVTWDLGLVGYFYPGASDEDWLPAGADFDFYEVKIAPSFAPAEGFTLGGALYYAPEFTGSNDSALYYEVNAAYTISDMVSVSGAVGHQTTDQAGYFVLDNGGSTDEYTTWNLGVTATVYGFGLDLRYTDTDEAITNLAGEEVTGSKAVLTIKRAL